MKIKYSELFKFSGIPVLIASLCCLSPLILVALGLATVSFATSLTDILYGEYKWYFRVAGLLALCISFVVYTRRKVGVCTIDEAIRKRNELINKFMIFLITSILAYIFFLYVVVHYVGVFAGVWK
jgi:hypothetical protein